MDFDYKNSFSYWISRLSQVMQETFNKALADSLHEKKISWPQWLVINHIGQAPGATPAEIAEALQVDRSAITRLLDRLEQKKLLSRVREGVDRRVVNIYLSSEGKLLLKTLNRLAADHQAHYLESLPTTEQRVFKANIQKMLNAGGVDSKKRWVL